MLCNCTKKTIVLESRLIENGMWRRRKCNECGRIFQTVEKECQSIKKKRTTPQAKPEKKKAYSTAASRARIEDIKERNRE